MGGMCCIRAQKWRKTPVLGVWVPHQSHTFFWGEILSAWLPPPKMVGN